MDIFTTKLFADIIVQSLDHYCRRYNAATVSYVIMPNHIHFILHFKEETQLGSFMRDFKKWTSVCIKEQLKISEPERINDFHFSGPKGQTFKLWMDRYDHVYLATRRVARIKMNYIHNNPVKKGMAKFPEDFEFSSAGIYFKEMQPPLQFVHFNELF